MQLRRSTEEIAEIIGEELTLFLVEQLPSRFRKSRGRKSGVAGIYIPKRVETLTPSHFLVRAIGYEAAAKLCERMGGNAIAPARCVTMNCRERDAVIRRLSRSGVDRTHIAACFRLSLRTVRRALSRPLAPLQQSPPRS